MKAAYFEHHGGLDQLLVGDLPDPVLGPGDVLIQVRAAALNRLDLFVREGWPGLRLPLPHVGGTDLAGVVLEVGTDVQGVRVGDEVIVNPGLNFPEGPDGRMVIPAEPDIIGETRWGGLAEQCVVPATHVVPKPDSWSWEEAAAAPLTSLTAMQMLRKADAKAGDQVLVVGGGGGVAVMAIQLAKALGCTVYVTTGGPDKVERVKALGADHVIDYLADPDWWKTVYGVSGKRGMDVVVDSVGQATWKHSLRTLRAGGRLVTCGATTGPIGETHIQLVFWKQLSILGSTMGTPRDLQDAMDLMEEGRVRPIVDSTWSLDQIHDAQAHMEAGKQFGKIVIRIS